MKKRKNTTLLRMPKRQAAITSAVESRILFLRHQRVILDADIAQLYGLPVRQLNQQVKRNQERFPSDFVFQLTANKDESFRSQIVTSTPPPPPPPPPPFPFPPPTPPHPP